MGQQRLDETVEAIRREGGQAVAVSADITRLESFPLIVEQAKAAFDLPDIAIYAPVAPPSGFFEEFDDEDLDRAYAYVVKGRSEEHTSELQALMRISYAVF